MATGTLVLYDAAAKPFRKFVEQTLSESWGLE